ncbi:MAG: NAD(+)/NADH kinase [Chloroflexota bacterium]|nr:NAD(+)/NADH kinase [Chloroflexota bacterium]
MKRKYAIEKGIGVLHHPQIPASRVLGAEIARWLEARGYRAWQGSGWDEETVRAHIARLDLLIVLGGDGTIIRSARMGTHHQVPILGVKMGQLGFLAEAQPEEWEEKLAQVMRGEYWVEERMMLSAKLGRDGEHLQSFEALNDVVVSRGGLARVISLAAEVNGAPLTTYLGDGLIVSTATGCTAYSLACGGPILPPELRNILLVPIAPHLSLDRAIVLADGATISINVSTDHAAILTVDGQSAVDLADGDRVLVQASSHTGLFVRTQERGYFYRTLMKRLSGSYALRNADEEGQKEG